LRFIFTEDEALGDEK